MTRKTYIENKIKEAKQAIEFGGLSAEGLAEWQTALELYESLLTPKPDPLERIAHALEVIAAHLGFMEKAISLHEGSKVGETDPETINSTVEAIRNGGNH